MKKRILALCLLLCLLLLAGCAEKTEKPAALTALQEAIGQNDALVGVASLGYVDSESTEEALQRYVAQSDCAEAYPFLENSTVIGYEGAELYAFVPGKDDYAITVRRAEMNEDGTYRDLTDQLVYEGKPGEVLILRCNVSEIHANVWVEVSGAGEPLTFHPMLSMMDGHLATEPGCYDFSVYEDAERSAQVQAAYMLLLDKDETQHYIRQGMSLLYTDESQIIDGQEALLFVLGTEQEDRFVQERLYAVSGQTAYWQEPETDRWMVLGEG